MWFHNMIKFGIKIRQALDVPKWVLLHTRVETLTGGYIALECCIMRQLPITFFCGRYITDYWEEI